jgi:hypothetical protein
MTSRNLNDRLAQELKPLNDRIPALQAIVQAYETLLVAIFQAYGGRQMQWAIFSISAARSPMTTHAAIVLPVVTRGIMDASAIRRFLSP